MKSRAWDRATTRSVRSWGRQAAIFIASRLAGEESATCRPSTSSETGSSSGRGVKGLAAALKERCKNPRVLAAFSRIKSRPDATYATEAAVIEGYEFDRVAFRVVGSTFRSADLAHWLAMDVAARALVDAGFPEGRGLPRESTGVLVGNTLTGEFARAGLLRRTCS